MSAPLVFIDAGASGGIPLHWRAVENIKVVDFDLFGGYTHNFALSDKNGETDFYISQEPQTSSLLKPNTEFLSRHGFDRAYETVKTVEVKTAKLDDVLDGPADFIKIDTQGTAYEILRGAEKTLQSVMGLEMEVGFAPRYLGEKLFCDIHSLLADFTLYDIQRRYWNDHLVYADCLYFRRPEENREKILKYITICRVYGYRDEALDVLESHSGLFADKEISQIKSGWREPYRLPLFKGRDRIEITLRKIISVFNKKSRFRGDRTIGRI